MSITRAHYRERQRLTADDLRAEQDYRLGLAGRHHLTHHEWGVVRGLRVIPNDRGGYTLTRGVAIDGYGREILVPEPVDLTFTDLKTCWWVLLYYCENPEQVPRGRRCEEHPAPRIAQHAVWDVTERFTFPAEVSNDFASARAAGRLTGVKPWPVVVARVGLTCQAEDVPDAVDYSATRYVRHRASVVRSPHGRALMQLGLTSRTDIYRFLLSTRDEKAALARRVGIDRDGVTHIWRPLVVFGATAVGQVAVSQSSMLQITSATPGNARRIRVTGEIDPVKNVLSASLLTVGDVRAPFRPALDTIVDFKSFHRPMAVPVQFGDTQSASFSLLDPIRAEPIAWAESKRRGKQTLQAAVDEPLEAPIRYSVVLQPTGGVLHLQKLQRSVEAVPPAVCGDLERHRADAGDLGTPVVQFRPASEIASDPLAREIHAVTTSKPTDSVPKTELRISGGAEDESDAATRVSVGAWIGDRDTGEWMPSLRMDGGRRLEILARAGTVPDHPLLEVDDTVYLPPIGNKDPLLPDMMAMAFIAGLRQIGRVSTVTTATLNYDEPEEPPQGAPTIVRGERLAYSLDLDYDANTELKRAVEIVRGVAGTGHLAFRSIPVTELPDSGTPTVFSIENFSHSASRVAVEVLLLVAESNVPKVVVSSALELVVADR